MEQPERQTVLALGEANDFLERRRIKALPRPSGAVRRRVVERVAADDPPSDTVPFGTSADCAVSLAQCFVAARRVFHDELVLVRRKLVLRVTDQAEPREERDLRRELDRERRERRKIARPK